MTQKLKNKSTLTTIGIDRQTNRLIDKLCKRYSLKKGEMVKLAFGYLDKACINPAEAPESVKAELSKINKRQDDIIRFIRHYEEEQLNPMIRTANSIALRFDSIVAELKKEINITLQDTKEQKKLILTKISEVIHTHAEVINTQAKQIKALYQLNQKDNTKLLQLINLYAELSICGMMETKKKENLKVEIVNLINDK